jgi:hypothetical protein
MKKLIVSIGLALTLTSVKAQNFTTNYIAVAIAPLLTATNYSFDIYGTYAPKLPKHLGGGIMAIYNVNNYVGAGIGVDYLGKFTLLSANATLQLPIKPFSGLTTNWLSTVAVVPFQLMGGGLGGVGSANNGIVTEDTGVYLNFGHVLSGQLNVGAAWGQWLNAGTYTGHRDHVFFGWSKGF